LRARQAYESQQQKRQQKPSKKKATRGRIYDGGRRWLCLQLGTALCFSKRLFAGSRKESATPKAGDGNRKKMGIFDSKQRVDVTFNLRVVSGEWRVSGWCGHTVV
jgi:hypothetical protein